jgi:xylulokinase
MTLLAGLDLGTTGCKAAIYDDRGHLLGESYLEYPLLTLSPVMVEQDPNDWWNLAGQAIQQAAAKARADRSAVQAVAVSSQGISFVLLDAMGRPLGNAINWLDSRAQAESEEVLQSYSEQDLFARTGKRASPWYVLPKLLWLRKNRPEQWRKASKLLMAHDYLVYKLCGAHVTDHSMAGGTLLYALDTLDWDDTLLDTFAIPRALLPDIHWSGTPVARLLPEVAKWLDLSEETLVVVGGQDQKCAALGAGIADELATLSLGTASAICQIMDEPLVDPQMRIPSFTFVQRGRWILEGVVGTGAGSLRWYRDTFARGTPYPQLDAEAALAPPGSDGVIFLPHLGGATSPHWQSTARGTFHGLSLATSRGYVTRALLEGVAYQLRQNLDITQQLAGPVRQAILFGGGARSAFWRQIIADVLNLPIVWTPVVDTASLGAAMLGGLGYGLFATLEEARAHLVTAETIQEPDPQRVEIYAEGYERYCQLEAHLLRATATHRTRRRPIKK